MNFKKFKKLKRTGVLTPYRTYKKTIKPRSEYVTSKGLISIQDLAKELGTTENAIIGRIKKGFFHVVKQVGKSNFVNYKIALKEMFDRSTSITYFTAKQIVERRVKMGFLDPELAEQEILDREKEYEESTEIQTALKSGKFSSVKPEGHKLSDKPGSSREAKLSAEAQTKIYQAKLAKLKYLKESGMVVDTQEVDKVWGAIAITVQKSILSIPDRVCTLFASLIDPREIDSILRKELNYALNKLNFDIKGLVPDMDNYEIDED